MADIRINAIATTATDFASDDYIAIDGTANGTRKVNAKTANLTFGDVTFGTSGPSAKSSIAARAARQGLGQDGTAASSTSVPAYGTSDFTASAFINTDLTVNVEGIFGSNSAGGFGLFVYSTGQLGAQNIGIATVGSSSGTISANKTAHVVYTRSGTTGTFYINGVSAGTITDSTNYTAVTNLVGNVGGLNVFKGSISGAYLYNRALSSAEVVSLYEAGAPSGADYPTQVAGTALVTGANSTFSSNTGFWDLAGSSIGSGKATIPSASYIGNGSLFKKGYRYRVSVNVLAVSGTVALGDSAVALASWTTTGVKTVDVTATANYFNIGTAAGNTAEIDDVTVVPLGLLLAPDAAQAGGGLTWYDTSGNAANITLPASGVTWNVPSSFKTASGWTFGGTVLAGTAAAQGILASKNGSRFISLFSTSGGNGAVLFDSTSALRFGTSTDETGSGFSELARLTASGNLLLKGDGVDSANGKLQLATHTTSAGGIGFGTDTSYNRVGAGLLAVDASSGTDAGLYFRLAGVNKTLFAFSGTNTYLDYTGSLVIRAGVGGTTALTLDSSQNATFAGTVKSTNTATWAFFGAPAGGADRDIAIFGVSGVTNGFTTRWNNATSTIRINIANMPTSSVGLASGDLWVDTAAGNVIKRV